MAKILGYYVPLPVTALLKDPQVKRMISAYSGGGSSSGVPATRTVNGYPLSADVVITKSDVGLGSVDNTSDADKPVSTATTTALALKADDADLTTHTSNTSNPHSVTKAQVGLSNVDNTSDANKPVSTLQQAALDGKSDTGHVHTFASLTSKPTTLSGYGITDGYTDENVRDVMGATLVQGTNITITVDDNANTITIDASGVGGYTDEEAQDAVGGMVDSTLTYVDGTPSLGRAAISGDITISAGSNTAAISSGVIVDADVNASAAIDATKIADGSVTNTEFQYINTLSSNAQTQLDTLNNGGILLAKGSVSAVASLDLDLSSYYTTYDTIIIHVFGCRPVTDAVTLYCRLSADGSTYANGASDYAWGFSVTSTSASTGSFDAADNQIRMSQNVLCGNAAEEHANIIINIKNPNNSALRPLIGWQTDYLDTGGLPTNVVGTGARLAAQVLRGVQILYSSGNVAAAQYKVIGYKN